MQRAAPRGGPLPFLPDPALRRLGTKKNFVKVIQPYPIIR